MYRSAYSFCFLVLAIAGLGGCSSGPSSKESKSAAKAPDKIQGKVQEILTETTATDVALNAGGPSVYLLDGLRRYRLFFRKGFEVDATKEYVAEGVDAQKAIDALGDPDQGKNGYPLAASCLSVVRTAWPGLAMDVTDLHAQVLCARIKRYPARHVFLVTRIREVTPEEKAKKAETAAGAEGEEIAEVTVPADKQSALLIEGATVQTAPLWAPTGGTAHCKLVIDKDGKVSDLETGAQLCEAVPWSQFRYKPTVKRGKPVSVETEVAVRFEARK
ncbi:MAG TPA: hypothetical protein VMT86_17250 [Bryobacteraceae bacterium]|nr:hypothetical protein [Bryobacteraceae bacterium]